MFTVMSHIVMYMYNVQKNEQTTRYMCSTVPSSDMTAKV